ncbi:fimbrial biogenesis outer membrane usher protein [bacterium]|nr:fimbrial biogenesis outer membrane usher protein [bacterium]
MMCRALLGLIALVFCAGSASAAQLPKQPDDAVLVVPPVAQGDEPGCDGQPMIPRLLRAIVNASDSQIDFVFYQRPCGALLASVDTLKSLRIRIEGRPTVGIDGELWVNLNAYPKLSYELDLSRQRVLLEGEPDVFYPTLVDFQPEEPDVAPTANPGIALNYGVGASGRPDDGSTQYSAFLNAAAFARPGVIVSNWVWGHAEGRTSTLRLQTTAIRDMPQRIAALRIGDVRTPSGGFGGSLPVAGVQYATNFGTRPYLQITPTALLSAATRRDAGLQIRVDPFGDGSAQAVPVAGSQVPYGPVEVVNLPVYQNGRYRLVLRDSAGNLVESSQANFFARGLLRQGLSEFDYAIGARRPSIADNRYTTPAAGFDHRYGLTRWLTLEGHVEADRDVQVAGFGGRFRVPWVGVAAATVAASRSDDSSSDSFASVSLENRYQSFSYAGLAQCNGRDFTTISGPRGQTACSAFASLGAPLPWGDRISTVLGQRIPRDGAKQRNYGVNYVTHIPRISLTVSAGVSWFETAGDSTWSARANINMPLGAPFRLAGKQPRRRLRFRPSTTQVAVDATQSEFADARVRLRSVTRGNFGGRTLALGASTTLAGPNINTLSAGWSGRKVNAAVNVTESDGDELLSASASSGLVFIDRSLFTTRPVLNSFALVDLGEDNDGVFVNGARANSRGKALVTPLIPYVPNNLRIDVTDLPLSAAQRAQTIAVTPRFRSGVVLRPTLPRYQDAIISIQLAAADGSRKPLPYRAYVQVAAPAEVSPVGSDGAVYVTGEQGPMRLDVFVDGGQCRVDFELPDGPEDDNILALGPYLCEPS